jgi:hypothetical protein
MALHSDLPTAGWYTDPSDSSRIRYWNGQAWTVHAASPEEQVESKERLVSSKPAPRLTPSAEPEPDEIVTEFDLEYIGSRTPREATVAMFFGAIFVVVIVVAAVALITSS